MRRWLLRLALAAPVAVLFAFAGLLWSASGQLLAPSWHGATRDLGACPSGLEKAWGPACGNLRATHALAFEEIRIPALGGYDLPGWLVRSAENGGGPAAGAILLVHGGGSDRRELTRHVRFYLSRHLDVLAFDLACHGEAPCPVPGLTYGERESRDLLSAYLWLTARYGAVLAMGSSVGASALLEALPAMPRLTAVVAENPMATFQRLIAEFPGARSTPAWMKRLLVGVTMLRGRFSGLENPQRALRLAGATTPILFVHSLRDGVVSHSQTRELAEGYAGPKTTWFPDRGDHGTIRDVDPADYERRVAEFLDTTRPALTPSP